MFGVQEGAVGSQEVAGKWRCMNDFSQKVEDFSRFFEIGSFRPWRRRRWSRLAERSPKPVFPLKMDHRKWVSIKTRKIRRFSRRTCRPGYWPVNHPGNRVIGAARVTRCTMVDTGRGFYEEELLKLLNANKDGSISPSLSSSFRRDGPERSGGNDDEREREQHTALELEAALVNTRAGYYCNLIRI